MSRSGTIFILLFLLLLAAPFALRRVLGLGESASPAGSGDNRLVILTPHNQDIRQEFSLAFTAWYEKRHPGSTVTLDYRSVGGTNDIYRLLKTTYDARRDANGNLPPAKDVTNIDYDMVWGGGDFFFDRQLKPLKILAPLDSPDVLAAIRQAIPNPALAGVMLYDFDAKNPARPPVWVGVCLSVFGIVYNPDMYDAVHLPYPATWNDLTAPELAGSVALADPTHSASASVAYMTVVQRCMADAESDFLSTHPGQKKAPDDVIAAGWRRGMGMLLRIAANARYFTDSSERVPTDVGNGDAAVGMAIDFYGHMEEATVGPDRARFVAPVNATSVNPDPIAILYSSRRKALAQEFVQYLLTSEAQLLWIKKSGTAGGPRDRILGRPPIRADLYSDQTDWYDHNNPFKDTSTFNQRGDWMGTYNDDRIIWAASWIDDRQSLQNAYRAILAVKSGARRSELLARLADPPLTMQDVLDIGAARKKSSDDPARFAAQLRLDWAKRFRDFYDNLGKEAEASTGEADAAFSPSPGPKGAADTPGEGRGGGSPR